MRIKATHSWMICFSACLAVAGPAHAEEEGTEVGNIIHMECTSPDEQVETGCLMRLNGFLSGWYTAVHHIAQKANVPVASLEDHCIPDGTSLGDVRDALVKGLEALPENGQNEDGNVATMTILAKAYPCGEVEPPVG